MKIHGNDRTGTPTPAIIVAILAVIGAAAAFFVVLDPTSGPEGDGEGMITAAAVYRAGATITPSAPSQRHGLVPG